MIPIPLTTWAAGGVAAVLAVMLGVQTSRLADQRLATSRVEGKLSELRTKVAERERDLADDIAEQVQQARNEEIAIRYKQQESHNASLKQAEIDLAAAGRNAASSDRLQHALRERLAASLARGECAPDNPAAAANSPATTAPGSVYADVLGRVDDAARELAVYADAARRAGIECQQHFDAVSTNRVTP